MTPNLTPVLPGELIQNAIGWKSIAWWPYPSVDLGDEENKSEDKHPSKLCAEAVCRRLETKGYGGDGKIFPLRTSVEPIYPEEPIARANGIGGEEPTFDGIKYGNVIPAEPSADHRVSDWSAIQTYLLNLKEGERVVECGVSGMTGTKGTVYISKGGDVCVRWDNPKGMGTSATGGTRRISDVITESPKPDEVSWPEYDENGDSDSNETNYLYYLVEFANEETTPEDIASHLNLRFNNNRTAESVSDKLKPTPPKPEGDTPIVIMTTGGVSEYRSHPDLTPEYHGGFMSPERANQLESDLSAARADSDGWRTKFLTQRDEANSNTWIWMGDGEDHPESLTCPVIMSADQLREFVAAKESEQRLRAALEVMLASARPHPTENPSMFKAWEQGKASLAPASSGKGEG